MFKKSEKSTFILVGSNNNLHMARKSAIHNEKLFKRQIIFLVQDPKLNHSREIDNYHFILYGYDIYYASCVL